MATLADFLSGNQNPGMALPPGPMQPYANNVGAAPMSFSDVLSSLAGQQPQQFAQMQQAPQQQPQGNLSLAGDPATLSGRIQQWLGAKPQDTGGQVSNILSGRFQQPNISLNDVGIAAQQTAAQGAYVPAQQIANSRITASMDQLSKIADLQKSIGEANYYNALGANGGGRGEGMAAAMKIMNENNSDATKQPITFTQAYMLATAKQGQGVTVDPATGGITTMAGAPQAAGAMKFGDQSGTEAAKLQYAGPIAGATANAKNASDIAAAAPKAAQEGIGKAQGEAQVDLASLQANLPQVSQTIDKLINLSNTATYTTGGKLLNSAIRQAGLPVPQGAIDSADYESTVKNSLLPSLKAAFGARITNADLQYAADTLGNQSLSPPERKAQLQSYFGQKMMTAMSEQRLVNNLGASPITPGQNPVENIPAQNAAQPGRVVKFSDLPQ